MGKKTFLLVGGIALFLIMLMFAVAYHHVNNHKNEPLPRSTQPGKAYKMGSFKLTFLSTPVGGVWQHNEARITILGPEAELLVVVKNITEKDATLSFDGKNLKIPASQAEILKFTLKKDAYIILDEKK